MIKGLTHDESGDPIKIVRYKGKISAGYSPMEEPNKNNYPVPCGFFRMMKEITRNQRVQSTGATIGIKEWVLNEEVQKLLVSANNNNPQPRRLEICCLNQRADEIWESYLAKYSQSEGLLCRSHGRGTVAKHLVVNGKERKWEERFKDQGGCLFKDCPDYKAGKCKQMGLLKCYPTIDLAVNPYRFETRSINTIMGFESAFIDINTLVKAAHMVKQMEAGRQLPFDGIFGARLFMIHHKTKSGGKDVYVTDLYPTPDFTESIMEPVKRGLAAKARMSRMIGEAGSISMIGEAGDKLLEMSKAAFEIVDAETVPLSLEDQREIPVNFPSDAGDEVISEVVVPEGTDVLTSNITTPSEGSKVPEDLNKAAAEALLSLNK